MKTLFPSFAPPETWRNSGQTKKLEGEAWRALRLRIVQRDNYTCSYCGYKSEKYQIVDHIDGNPENNTDKNLQVICQMCNLIKHAGQGCAVQGIVDLYEESKHTQNEIISLTRKLRDEGKSDSEIIKQLGLKRKVEFKMDRDYPKKLIGFVTSRQTKENDGMYNGWLAYHNRIVKLSQNQKLKVNNDG